MHFFKLLVEGGAITSSLCFIVEDDHCVILWVDAWINTCVDTCVNGSVDICAGVD